MNFALTGLAGYIAPRHLQAIRDTGNQLVAAVDIHDSVGIVDSFFPETAFFTEFERFDRHLELLRRGPKSDRIHMVSVCSPNHLHDAHIRLALRVGADALCEKPLVLNPWNLDQLEELESEHEQRVWTVLQLRTHPALLDLKARLDACLDKRYQVRLTYVTSRGKWYRYSWKGDAKKSGGVPTNIGVHFFDMLMAILVVGLYYGAWRPARTAFTGGVAYPVIEQAAARTSLPVERLPRTVEVSDPRMPQVDRLVLKAPAGDKAFLGVVLLALFFPLRAYWIGLWIYNIVVGLAAFWAFRQGVIGQVWGYYAFQFLQGTASETLSLSLPPLLYLLDKAGHVRLSNTEQIEPLK